jgi:tetrahydromethanopterin S-methyltransferase subunit F
MSELKLYSLGIVVENKQTVEAISTKVEKIITTKQQKIAKIKKEIEKPTE